MRRGRIWGILPTLSGVGGLAAVLSSGTAPAHAYTISSAVSTGCHEQITTAALRAVREQVGTPPPITADRNEQALIDDLEFSVPGDLDDLGGVTLLLAVRDNDLKGREANDVTELALVHGDPALQPEHCLRSTTDDEPAGSENAVANCRDFIRERVGEALAGLDAAGSPDAAARTSLAVFLALRHRVDASLPTYYVRIGQALHALEDSFSHTYRTADGMGVTTVLNWVDAANGKLDERRDGPPHAREMDRCDDADDLRARNHQLATEAATALLRATLDPASPVAQRAAAADRVLDQYLGFAPGCNFDDGWCDAPERKYGDGGGIGCNVVGSAPRASRPLAVIVAALLVGRRRRRRRVRGGALPVALALLLTAAAAARPARAEEPVAGSHGAKTAPEKPSAPPPANEAPARAWGGYLGGSGSINYGGLAVAAGARWRATKHWTFGLDAEWNPWFAVNGAAGIRAGAFNGYATAIVRIPLATERFDLRATANLGTSTLLIDLYGAPKGSTGPFFGLSPLGIEWAISPRLFLIANPLGYALPIPHPQGVPFAFPQYRATVGLELYAS